jgi:flagellar basal body-associated protein FliL
MTMPAPRPTAAPSARSPGARAADPKFSDKTADKSGDSSQATPPTKSRTKLIAVLVAVLIVLGAGYMAKSKFLKPHYAPGEAVPAGQVLALGTLTVNTDNGQLVQVGIDLQLTKPASEKAVEQEDPQLKNAAIDDLSSWSSQQLLRVVTRAKLKHQLLTSFQQVLGTVDGAAPQVSAVYFTSFLLQ